MYDHPHLEAHVEGSPQCTRCGNPAKMRAEVRGQHPIAIHLHRLPPAKTWQL